MQTRIAIVESHPDMRAAFRQVLEQEKSVTIALETDRTDALLQEIEQIQPDIVMLEQQNPASKTLELISAIQESSDTPKKICILITTCDVDFSYLECLVRAGIQGILVKDYAGEELINAIRNIRQGRFFLCTAFSTAFVKKYITSSGAAIRPE